MKRAALFAATAISAIGGACSPGRPQAPNPETQGPAEVERFDIFSLSIRIGTHFRNPFTDATLDAEFAAPGGERIAVPGFYGDGRWMVRFRPATAGTWTWIWTLTRADGVRQTGRGSFLCSHAEHGQGRIRQNPSNPNRWIYETGTPYFPIGFEDGVKPENPTFGIDGEGRDDPHRTVSIDEYFDIYGSAGFNLFRFSQRNVTYSLFDNLDQYREPESAFTDRLLDSVRRHGIRVMFGFFGSWGQWPDEGGPLQRAWRVSLGRLFPQQPEEALHRPNDQRILAKEKRFIRYCIARWGVYADFWELLNERDASDEWIRAMADYVHSIDPDRKPVTTSWDRPANPSLDLVAPHWYESESESDSDLRVRQQAGSWRRFGKPVIWGEQGNSGMNWDPTSARRMRIREWTALFEEVGLILWNTSWSKAGMHHGRYSPGASSNIYLGPEERKYIRVLADFASGLDSEVKMAPVSVSDAGVRAYALRSPRLAAVYLHRWAGDGRGASGALVRLNVPDRSSLVAQWIDPATGNVLARAPVSPGVVALTVPPFGTDAALMVEPDRR